jgi:DNA topoisomerase VI subunit B
VYKGNPFQIEVALAWGGAQSKDDSVKIMRFANRVPLLYQQGACGVTKAISTTNWKAYGIQQSGQSIPVGPLTIIVHMASVWVPFTSEAKEAIAHYDDIIKEIKLALQDAGRDLQKYVHKKQRAHLQLERANLFERYIPEVADALHRLTGKPKEQIHEGLVNMVKKDAITQKIEAMQAENTEYDEEWAKIGKEDAQETLEEPIEEPAPKKVKKKE